jgi:serine/threonine-protein kinase HipA
MADLRVELYGRLVGHLVGTSSRTFDVRTDRSVLEHWPPGSTLLSESVPLSLVENRARAAQRRNYFAELLSVVRTTLAAVAEAAGRELPDRRAYAGLQDDVVHFASNLLAGDSTGQACEA